MAAPPFYVKAVYEYQSGHDDDLNFPVGQIISVTEIEDDDWYVGQYTDTSGSKQDGLFPKNYVERCEPPAPPRPSRPRPKKDVMTQPDVEPAERTALPSTAPIPAAPSPVAEKPLAVDTKTANTPTTVPAPPVESLAPKPEPSPAAPVQKEAQAEPSAKSTGNSFRDRIAAFNKPAAPPIAPKPAGVSASSGFVKKPFVAPPPSRNAYVPPPREAVPPPKAYRREEDPEIAEAQAQAEKDAHEAGLTGQGDEEDEAPKAASLKDRIALLQKQQQEQAARRAESSQKPKPNKSSQPHAEDDSQELPTEADEAPLAKKMSHDSASDMSGPPRGAPVIPAADLRRSAKQAQEPAVREEPSDGNEADQSGAGDTTEDAGASSTEIDDTDDRSRARAEPPAIPSRTSTGGLQDPVAKELEHEEDQEEEDEVDEETRRKEELRARMAKMSGGMGMAGFFGPPPTLPGPKKTSMSSEKRGSASDTRSPPPPPQRMSAVPVPGMGLAPRVQSPGSMETDRDETDETGEPMLSAGIDTKVPPIPPERADLPPGSPSIPRGAPPVPNAARPAPLSPDLRAPPPPPPTSGGPVDPDDDEEEDEPTPMVEHERGSLHDVRPVSIVDINAPSSGRNVPDPRAVETSQAREGPPAVSEKRISRQPPPVPGLTSPTSQAMPDSRPPPPPPPHAIPPARSRDEPPQPAGDYESEYEGDYDTDIASTAPHKDALKSHEREPSIDEGTLSEDMSNIGPPPALPPHAPSAPQTQRAPPPPPPHQPPPRQSTDLPRAPPPLPPGRPPITASADDYDPYRYESSAKATKTARPPSDVVQESDPSLYAMPAESAQPPPRAIPVRELADLPPHSSHPTSGPPAPSSPVAATRQSADVSRRSIDRKSLDVSGRTGDDSMIARDVDLGESSQWWTVADSPPPVFQGRSDLLCEFEETSASKRGGRTTISKDVYVLFRDYSQTIVSARFDPKDPLHGVHLDQRHEPPPPRLTQEQLESAHSQLGRAVATAASQKANSMVQDGSPQILVTELLATAAPNALQPIGNRAYGALVYANMANSSVQQFDEIRPGDIVSFRNARFQGKHGPMHAKYSLDVGKPDHVAVVMEWDGTKKKIRAWEQGREKDRKVKVESFKVGDLRSGEVKVWRLVGREWVGWESNA